MSTAPNVPVVPPRILIIEDSVGDALLIAKALVKSMPGIEAPAKATTLAAGLKLLAEQEFDVVLLDRSLPDAQGFDGLHNIQSFSPKAPVVFLTGHRDEATAQAAIEQGAQDYLFKDTIDGPTIKRAIEFAVRRKKFESVLISRAHYDLLTGLANRGLFESRLDMALAKLKRQKGFVGVLFLDLDRFKQINDTLGHQAGDVLLKQVGVRLKKALRPYDTAARFGGDEFAILLEDMQEAENATSVAQKIIHLFDEPFMILGQGREAGVSIGIACAHGDAIPDREQLLSQADSAMYVAKRMDGNSFCCYAADSAVS